MSDVEQGGKSTRPLQDNMDEAQLNIFREKFSKYLNNLRGITTEKNKSITMELTYNLQDKKVLMLTLAEQLLSKVLVRSVQGIDKCTLVVPDEDK